MKSSLSREKIEDNICTVVALAKDNLRLHKTIRGNLIKEFKTDKKHIKYLSNRKIHMLIILANNCYYESVSLIYNLLNKDDRVHSFEQWLKLDRAQESKINNIRTIFKNSKLDQIRNNIGDHTNVKKVISPEEKFVLVINEEFVSRLDDVIKIIEYNINELFEYPLSLSLIDSESIRFLDEFSVKIIAEFNQKNS